MRKLMGFFLTTMLFTYSAQAEYRVFLLRISKIPTSPPIPSSPENNSDTNSTTTGRSPAAAPLDFRLVESTLDPVQYRGYYLVGSDEKVEYIDTWMCKGRTDQFASLCPNPKAQIPQD